MIKQKLCTSKEFGAGDSNGIFGYLHTPYPQGQILQQTWTSSERVCEIGSSGK